MGIVKIQCPALEIMRVMEIYETTVVKDFFDSFDKLENSGAVMFPGDLGLLSCVHQINKRLKGES